MRREAREALLVGKSAALARRTRGRSSSSGFGTILPSVSPPSSLSPDWNGGGGGGGVGAATSTASVTLRRGGGTGMSGVAVDCSPSASTTSSRRRSPASRPRTQILSGPATAALLATFGGKSTHNNNNSSSSNSSTKLSRRAPNLAALAALDAAIEAEADAAATAAVAAEAAVYAPRHSMARHGVSTPSTSPLATTTTPSSASAAHDPVPAMRALLAAVAAEPAGEWFLTQAGFSSLRQACAEVAENDHHGSRKLTPLGFAKALFTWSPSLGGGKNGGASLLASAILGDDGSPFEWADFCGALEQLRETVDV